MSWRDWRRKISFRQRKDIPDGLFVICPGCGKRVIQKDKAGAMEVCPECAHHSYLPTEKRIEALIDPGSFEELFEDVCPGDPLNFVDRQRYRERLQKSQEETGLDDAIVTGTCRIEGREVCLGVMDFSFIGGSMGSVVGEKVARLADVALETRRPLVIISASGGARMQEGALALMQMAKTCCALARLKEAGIMFISVLTNPTTGGVLASFSSVGDVIIAEPKALIGFTGPRVIKETIRQELPPGFQRSEFLLSHGLIDMIVHRRDLRTRIASLVQYCLRAAPPVPEVVLPAGPEPVFGEEQAPPEQPADGESPENGED